MATVIDELVLTLGLDPTKFTEGQKKAVAAIKELEDQATRSGKETEAQSKKLLDFFTNLKREALGLVGAFYGGRGIADMVSHLTHLDASGARLANTIRTSPEVLAKWRIAMKEVGGSAEEADAAIGGLSDAIQDFLRHPNNPPMGLLTVAKQIGISPQDIQDPVKFLEALAQYGKTVPPEKFAAVARDVPGMNQNMLYLLMELDKRLSAAEKVTPAGGGAGAFSKEFIASLALFSTAADNVARVLLDWFIPAINSLTTLFTRWLNPAEGNAAHYEKLHNELRHKFGAPPAWLSNIFGLPPEGPTPKLVPRGDTGIGGVFGGATGFSIEEGGVVVNSGTFPTTGAKGAAAVSHVSNAQSSSRTSTTTTEVNIGTINVNAPNATDAPGIARSLKPALGSSLAAPINSAY